MTQAPDADPPSRKGPVVRLAKAIDAVVPVDLKRTRDRGVAAAREATGLATRALGLPAITHRLRSDRRAGILLYHAPEAAVLERHLDYLGRRHVFVPYALVAEAVGSGDWSDVPPKALAVCFDDGHAQNLGLVPLLAARGIVPTIFVCTAIVGTSRRFWWTLPELDGRERDRLMGVPDAERRRRLEELAGWSPTREYPERQALDLEEIASLRGKVDFQAHTRFHPILPACPEDVAVEEIEGSRRDVEALTGMPCFDFAYPNGRYGERETRLLRAAGFRSGRTIETGWNEPGTDPYRLRIIGMPDGGSLNVVAAQSTALPFLRDLMYLS